MVILSLINLLSSNEGKTIGDIKIAKNSWIARDEAELNVSIGDELTISISDSSWAYGSKANSSEYIYIYFMIETNQFFFFSNFFLFLVMIYLRVGFL